LIHRGFIEIEGLLREIVMDELTERIVELEIRYTHQNSIVEELNTELTLANARIDRLERAISGMHEMLGNMGPELTESPDE
jgi:SlyX protein